MSEAAKSAKCLCAVPDTTQTPTPTLRSCRSHLLQVRAPWLFRVMRAGHRHRRVVFWMCCWKYPMVSRILPLPVADESQITDSLAFVFGVSTKRPKNIKIITKDPGEIACQCRCSSFKKSVLANNGNWNGSFLVNLFSRKERCVCLIYHEGWLLVVGFHYKLELWWYFFLVLAVFFFLPWILYLVGGMEGD